MGEWTDDVSNNSKMCRESEQLSQAEHAVPHLDMG